MGTLRAALAGLSLMACACGSSATAAVAPATKSPIRVQVSPSPSPRVVPFEAIDFISRSEGWALILSQADAAVEIAHSRDGGATWGAAVRVTGLSVAEGEATPRFGVKFQNARVGWVFGPGIFESDDGGQTWMDTNAAGEVSDVALVGGIAWAVTGCDPRYSKCPSALLRWDPAHRAWMRMAHQPPIASGPFELIGVSGSRAFVVQQTVLDTRLIRTDDGGATWATMNITCRGFGMPVAAPDGTDVWMVCPGQPEAGSQFKQVFASADGGSHWSLRSDNDAAPPTGDLPVGGYAQWLVATSATTAFLAMNRGDLYRTVDGGRTWIGAGISHGEGFFPAVQFLDPSTGWAVAQTSTIEMDGRVGLFRTDDAGVSWTLVSSMAGNVG